MNCWLPWAFACFFRIRDGLSCFFLRQRVTVTAWRVVHWTQLGFTLESWPNWEGTLTKHSCYTGHLNILTEIFQRREHGGAVEGESPDSTTYAIDVCARIDSGFPEKPSPAARCQSRDGWVAVTFVQAPRLRKELGWKKWGWGKGSWQEYWVFPRKILSQMIKWVLICNFICVMITLQMC